ncbi:MAG: hypothetical protein IPJ30_01070 [Acidobacteria bacterium]|nr:hypothetical protein [Acidobacteriota bacterium]
MKFVLPAILSILLAVSISGQTTTKRPVKKTPRPTPTVKLPPVEPTPEVVETAKTPAKKNERPTNQSPETRSKAENPPNYFYEFSQPKFIVSKITIEHDENGVGRISLMKQDWSEPDSDPIRVSKPRSPASAAFTSRSIFSTRPRIISTRRIIRISATISFASCATARRAKRPSTGPRTRTRKR